MQFIIIEKLVNRKLTLSTLHCFHKWTNYGAIKARISCSLSETSFDACKRGRLANTLKQKRDVH